MNIGPAEAIVVFGIVAVSVASLAITIWAIVYLASIRPKLRAATAAAVPPR